MAIRGLFMVRRESKAKQRGKQGANSARDTKVAQVDGGGSMESHGFINPPKQTTVEDG